MKALFLLMFVSQAQAVSVGHAPQSHITYGMHVTVLRGFYKGCTGVAVEEYDDLIVVRDAKCAGNLLRTDLTVPAQDLRGAN